MLYSVVKKQLKDSTFPLNAMLMETMKVYWFFCLWVTELYNMYCVSLILVAFLDLRFDHSVDLHVGKVLQLKMSK